MADITYFNALGDGGVAAFFYDRATLTVTASSATSATMTDASGAHVVFSGTKLHFHGQTPTSGTITGIDLFDSAGNLLTTVTAGNFDAIKLFDTYQTSGLLGVELQVIAGKDTITGSDRIDLMLGQNGKDHISGGKGADLIDGGRGNDTLTGGQGADAFYFEAGSGTDKITDFTDTGRAAARDHISMSTTQHLLLVATQHGADVDLAFGADHLILQNFQLSHLDDSDFTLTT